MVKVKPVGEEVSDQPRSQLVESRKVIKSDIPTVQIRDLIVKILEDSKAEEITVLDLSGKSDLAELMIIATGRSDRHIKSTAEYVCDGLKQERISYAIEGLEHRNWVLVDTGSVLLHVFNKESREAYNLTSLWA